jgi:hypothetical protein
MQLMYWFKFYPLYIELIWVDYFQYGDPKKWFDKQFLVMVFICVLIYFENSNWMLTIMLICINNNQKSIKTCIMLLHDWWCGYKLIGKMEENIGVFQMFRDSKFCWPKYKS